MGASDITAIVTGHREGRMAVASLRSLAAAVARAEAQGLTVQTILTLDRPDEVTRTVFEEFAPGAEILKLDAGDQGAARNASVDAAEGAFIAFLDADDLWQSDWLVRAHEFLRAADPETTVAHPEFNYFFEGQASVFRHFDQMSEHFDIDTLRATNYWDALAMCHRSIHQRFPYARRDVANGWAFEDWQWNQETLAAGIVHRVVPDTVIFKRRQRISQTLRAAAAMARCRPTPISSYSHPIYAKESETQ